MAYDVTKDPWANVPADDPNVFGASGATITPSDSLDLAAYAKGVVVVASGDLVILPAKNADGDTITFTGVPVGFVVPYRIRRVMATGTTATVASIDR